MSKDKDIQEFKVLEIARFFNFKNIDDTTIRLNEAIKHEKQELAKFRVKICKNPELAEKKQEIKKLKKIYKKEKIDVKETINILYKRIKTKPFKPLIGHCHHQCILLKKIIEFKFDEEAKIRFCKAKYLGKDTDSRHTVVISRGIIYDPGMYAFKFSKEEKWIKTEEKDMIIDDKKEQKELLKFHLHPKLWIKFNLLY